MDPRAVRWEYNVLKLGPSASPKHRDFLNEFGRDGWELVAFQPSGERAYPGEGAYFFKRPLPEGTTR